MRLYFNTNQCTAFPFCVPHSKHHRARGLSKKYPLCFDPKLGNDVCEICHIPCAFVACTSMLDKLWIPGIPSYKQYCYKPVTKCTYWPLLGSFKKSNIIQWSHISTIYETFYEIHQVVLDGISDNMASLVESGKYGAINTTDTTNNVFYIIMFTSEAYALQYNKTIDEQIITAGELFV